MKTIQPVAIWSGGTTKSGTVFNLYVISDNLSTAANFYYSISSQNTDGSIASMLAQGNLTMTGAEYDAYQTNQYAWDWGATQLGLTITGDYTPPSTQAVAPQNP